MHMKDYIDVSNQENVAPVYFQSLSLDFKCRWSILDVVLLEDVRYQLLLYVYSGYD